MRDTEGRVTVSIGLSPSALTIEYRRGFAVPRIIGYVTDGLAGAPAVPCQMRFVALPLDGDILTFDVDPGPALVVESHAPPFPAQERIPDIGIGKNHVRPITKAEARYFQSRYPRTLADIARKEQMGPLQIACVELRPVQWDPALHAYIFYPHLNYAVTFDARRARESAARRRRSGRRIGELFAEELNVLLSDERVAVAKEARDWDDLLELEEFAHVIITDNFEWPESALRPDGTMRPPAIEERGKALDGDLVAAFDRLADWRTAHGIRSRVVTVTDIVSGSLGEFTQNGFARDLQEVIRNFLKHAHRLWGTFYAVLAGDVGIVPIRHIAGWYAHPEITVYHDASNPPDEGRFCIETSGTVCKLRPRFTPIPSEPLATFARGIVIRYNPGASASALGWYYTTENDFVNRHDGFTRRDTTKPTDFIIVEGPALAFEGNNYFYWVRDVNSIPSDLYYASLVGENYSIAGVHDFDLSGNGLYGMWWQNNEFREETLDGVKFHSDVWVGRVPASNGAEAGAFVDKVMTYESLDARSGAHLRKVLYASDYWAVEEADIREEMWRQSNVTVPPVAQAYTHEDETSSAKLHVKVEIALVDGSPSHRLLVRHKGKTSEVPYDNSAADFDAPHWFFTTDDTYRMRSSAPTHFVNLAGYASWDVADVFTWDPIGLELSGVETEALRVKMNAWFPTFDNVKRLYADAFDVDAPPTLNISKMTELRSREHLTTVRIS